MLREREEREREGGREGEGEREREGGRQLMLSDKLKKVYVYGCWHDQ